VSFDFEILSALDDVDRGLARAHRRFKNATGLSAPQRERVGMARAALEALKAENKVGARDLKRLEGEAKAKQEEINKAKGALNSVKNNTEYQVLLKTIASREEDLAELETGILEAFEAQDERDGREKGCKERLATQQKDLDLATARVKKEQGEAQQQIDELTAARELASGKVDPQHLRLYETLLNKLGDAALAEVREEICQGCYMKVRPDQISKVRGRKELVTCFTCGRILVARG